MRFASTFYYTTADTYLTVVTDLYFSLVSFARIQFSFYQSCATDVVLGSCALPDPAPHLTHISTCYSYVPDLFPHLRKSSTMNNRNDHRFVSFLVRSIVRLSASLFTRRFPYSFASSLSRSAALLASIITRYNSLVAHIRSSAYTSECLPMVTANRSLICPCK